MKRYLLQQMMHEWRSNLWLAIEMMIVGGIIAYLATDLVYNVKAIYSPLGFEYEDVYSLRISYIEEESPEYTDAGEETGAINQSDIRSLIARLRANPLVESAAFSSNAVPFVLNYRGNNIHFVGQPDSIEYSGNLRQASPEIAQVLRLKSPFGQSASDIYKGLKDGKAFLSPYSVGFPEFLKDNESLREVKAYFGTDSTVNRFRIAGMIETIRRMSYEINLYSGTILLPIREDFNYDEWPADQIIFRVKPGMGKQFEEAFHDDSALHRQRNVLLSNLTSLSSQRLGTERSWDIEQRLYISLLGFFLIIIFLGLLGSFWFRVQQRTPEIGLRKVNGAKRGDILRRLFSEGTILLVTGFIPGAAIYLIIFKKVLYAGRPLEMQPWDEALVAIGISFVLMELILLLGIYFPARRAMKIEPAIALKDE